MDTTTDRFRGDPATLDTAEGIARVLRAAGQWLALAADTLEQGDREQAATFASLGALGAKGLDEKIGRLDA